MKYNTNQLLAFAVEAMRDALRYNRPSWDKSVGSENSDLRGFYLDQEVDENLIDDIRDAYNAIHDEDIDSTYAEMLKKSLEQKASRGSTNKSMAPGFAKPNGIPGKNKVPNKKPKPTKPAPPTYTPDPPEDPEETEKPKVPVERTKPTPTPKQNSRESYGEAYKVGSTIYWPRKRFGWNEGTVLAVTRHLGKFNVTVELNDGTGKVVTLNNTAKIHTKIPDTWTEIKAWTKNKLFGESLENITKNILKEAIIKTKIE